MPRSTNPIVIDGLANIERRRSSRKPGMVALLVAVAAAMPLVAVAQGMVVLNPMPSSYDLGGFTLSAPPIDNWREIQSSPTSLQAVYAERASDVDIKHRCHLLAESHPVDEPDYQGDTSSTAAAAWTQHTRLRGDALVAYTRVQPLEEAPHVYSFSLVVKVNGEDIQETFFVMLAPDKSEYFVAKLTTKEAQFREAPFYSPLTLALSTLRWRGDQSAGEKPAGENPASGSGSSAGSGLADDPPTAVSP